MAERRKKKERASGRRGSDDESNIKLTKEEDAIARFVRFNCPNNMTMFEGNEVHYFSGKKAVDLLVDSKKYGTNAEKPKFADNSSAANFLQSLLRRGLFFRAKKLVPKRKNKLGAGEKASGGKSRDVSKSPLVEKRKKRAKVAEEKEELAQSKEETAAEEEEKKEQEEEAKKKKRKVKLLFHDLQTFDVDTNDVYVWVFDPTPLWKQCVGVLIVLGTIGGCLFPLWPDWLRLGIYYLSVTGIALFGLLLGVALARTLLFGLIWLCTMGRHHLWILPNLMEDCGFFESFQPIYTYEYRPDGPFAKKEKKKKKDADKSKSSEDEKEAETDKTLEGASEEAPLLADPPQEEDTNCGETSSHNEQQKAQQQKAPDSDKESGASDEEEDVEGEDQSAEEGEATDEESNDSNSWEKLSDSQKSEESERKH